MPVTKTSATKANDAAFESAYQKLFETLVNNLTTANDEARKNTAVERAGAGLRNLRDAHDRMEAIINTQFP